MIFAPGLKDRGGTARFGCIFYKVNAAVPTFWGEKSLLNALIMPGQWKTFNLSPGFAASAIQLLADGSVMIGESCGRRWGKLTPNAAGDYINGSWQPLAPMSAARRGLDSALLRDGRVMVSGTAGDGANGLRKVCEIFDPLTNTWSEVLPPAGWSMIGDAPAYLRTDGCWVVGYHAGVNIATYDAMSEQWSVARNEDALPPEEADRLCGERGLALQPGRARSFASARGSEGDLRFPLLGGQIVGAKGTRRCVMPNGKELVVAGRVDAQTGRPLAPAGFFERDGGQVTPIAPPNGTAAQPCDPGQVRMLVLPNGQILVTQANAALQCYLPGGLPDDTRRPSITGVSFALNSGFTYSLFGRQLDGRCRGGQAAMSDRAARHSPVVCLRHLTSAQIFYCRTFDPSDLDGATGATIQSVCFHVPVEMPRGAAQLTVVTNGLVSSPVAVNVWVPQVPRERELEAWAFLLGSRSETWRRMPAAVARRHRGSRGKTEPSSQGQVQGSTRELARLPRSWDLQRS